MTGMDFELSTIGNNIKTFFEKKYFQKIEIESITFSERYSYLDSGKEFHIDMAFRFNGKWDTSKQGSRKSYQIAFEKLKAYVETVNKLYELENTDVED